MSEEMKVRFLVNRASSKILYMEAGKDFVDVLLGFLQLPVATILSEIAVEGMQVGSISNVYESLCKLNDSTFVVSKASLMKPPSPLRLSIESPKLLLPAPAPAPATMPAVVYGCYRDINHKYVSLVSGKDCPACGRSPFGGCAGTGLTEQMNVLNDAVAEPQPTPALASSSHSKGYVKDHLTFIVTDDLCIMPSSTIESIVLLNKLRVEKFSDLDSQEASVTAPQVLELLKVSFTNRPGLNHVFSIQITPPGINNE